MADQQHHRSRWLLALLTIPTLLVLAGCFRMDADFTINSDETVDLTMTYVDKTGMATADDMNCDDMSSGFPSEDVKVEQIEDGGHLGCKISAQGVPFSEFANTGEGGITVDGDKVTFSMDSQSSELGSLGGDTGSMDDLPDNMKPEVNISVTFPGKVLEASEGSKIDGHTVTWQGISALENGASATGEMEGSALGSSSWLLWVGIAVVIVVAAAIVLFVLMRKKKAQPAAAVAGQPMGYGGQGYGPQGYGGQGYSAPQQGQQYQQPGQYPNQGQPGQFPNQGQPGQYPNQGQPGQYPNQGQPGQFPQPGQPGQYPQPGQQGQQFPGQGQQYPSQGQ